MLQSGRAIAALAVVLLHATVATEAFVGPLAAPIRAVLSRGFLGVDFFFVLSGFLLLWTNFDRTCDRQFLARFTRGRFERIFVPYLPVGAGFALAYTVLPTLSRSDRTWAWLPTLTLLPLGGHPALSVAWTLQHELVFYAMLGIGLLFNRPYLIIAAWALLVLVNQVANFSTSIPLAFINVEFLFGCSAAMLVRHGWVSNRACIVLAILTAVVYIITGSSEENRVLFGLAMGFVIVPLVRLERTGTLAPQPGWLVYLGAASYSLYLVHLPLVSLLARVKLLGPTASLLCMIIGAAVAGIVYYELYEKRSLLLLKFMRSGRMVARQTVGEG